MKTKRSKYFTALLLLLPLFVATLETGCEEEKESTCTCGVENPLENLEWLKNIFESRSDVIKAYSFTSEGDEYIVIESSLENALMQFYNCSGELKCEVGGFVGGGSACDMPTEYWSDFEKNKKIINGVNNK